MSTKARRLLFLKFGQWGSDERGWSIQTREQYIWCIDHADRWLQERKNTSVVWAKTPELKGYLFSLPPNARTRNHRRQALVAFGAFLVEEGHTDVNHALMLPRVPETRRLPKGLSPRKARALEKASRDFGPKVELLIAVLLYSGLRRTAACSLEWSQFESNYEYVRFVNKGGDESVKYVHPKVRDLLKAWLQQCPDARWVFPSPQRNGHHLTAHWVEWAVKRVGEEAGLKVHPHQLRHTAATRLLELGADIREVQEFLDHASLSSTQIYTRVRPKRLKRSIDALDYAETEGEGGGT